ncbi:MAG: RNA polymerase sigma factor [Bacteroidia bacterium]
MQEEHLLVEQAKQDPAHFRPLYDKYYERIFLYVFQRVEDKETAFDITSQVFLKAMQSLHKYEFKGVPFASWLYRIAKSEVYTLFRQQQVKRVVNMETGSLKDMMDEIEEDQYDPYLEILKESITELDEQDIQLIEMRFFEKRAFKEIAEILDITENNAKVKTYRVLERLKKILIEKKRKSA